ncbi:MAG TPA: hypothetical protein PLC09_01595 [Holophaga sp.]|nr:hypothetical protein [Holophaga sp.]
MRTALALPALLLLAACTRGEPVLTKREAERDIKKDYPVVVPLRIPEKASPLRGSPEQARLQKLQEVVVKAGWFAVFKEDAGDRETVSFKPTPKAPQDLQTMPKGWQVPVAQAEFVKALRMEPTRDGAKVAYQIRLAKPTAHFPLFKAIYGANIGDTKERRAVYRKEGRDFILQDTDEAFRKPE